jgi:hypothetical protein
VGGGTGVGAGVGTGVGTGVGGGVGVGVCEAAGVDEGCEVAVPDAVGWAVWLGCALDPGLCVAAAVERTLAAPPVPPATPSSVRVPNPIAPVSSSVPIERRKRRRRALSVGAPPPRSAR